MSDIGKIVRFSGEVGVVVMYEGEECVRWDTDKEYDYEQYGFFDYEYLDEYVFQYINMDGSLKNQ